MEPHDPSLSNEPTAETVYLLVRDREELARTARALRVTPSFAIAVCPPWLRREARTALQEALAEHGQTLQVLLQVGFPRAHIIAGHRRQAARHYPRGFAGGVRVDGK